MIDIYTKKQDSPDWILLNDMYFNVYTSNEEISEYDAKLIQQVDKAKLTTDKHIETRYGIGTIRNLSTSCKTLLNIVKHPEKVVSVEECGSDVLKEEIYRLQGNRKAYMEQLWKLVLEHRAGDLKLYKELREQYTAEEWLEKREEVFKKLPAHARIQRLYKEEKLYDRLLTCVLNSPGLYTLQEYENILKKEYPEQILDKYRDEVNKMAVHTSDRKHYSYLVSLLRRMQRMKGGTRVVEIIVGDWKVRYKNRPAMMDELRKL